MNKSNDIERIWVRTSFKRWIKKQAIDQNKSVLELTEEMSRIESPFNDLKRKNDIKKRFRL